MNPEQNAPVLPLPIRLVTGYAVRLRGVRVQSRVGVTSAERASPQELSVAVDVELGGQLYPRSDAIRLAADYAIIVRIVDEEAMGPGDQLLETYALRVARRLGEQWPSALQIRVGVTKVSVPTKLRVDEAVVEVTLGRGRT